MERVPPNNLDAEKSVLGGLMLDEEAWTEIIEIVQEDDFYKPAHRKIFKAIQTLNQKSQPSDLVTVSNLLMETGELELVGGPQYLAELLEETPSAANIATHATIVAEKSTVRKIITVGQEIADQGYSQNFENIEQYVNTAEASIYNVAHKNTASGLTGPSELVQASLKKLEELFAQKSEITGVSSGFLELDDMTAGFQPGELTIVAARPSMGKTAFSLNIVLNAILREKKSVAYFSVEMAKESLMMRIISQASRIPLSAIRVGKIDDKQWPKLISTSAQLSEAKVYIDDTSGISPFEIRSKLRRMASKVGVDMVIVDYLQLMSLKTRIESREREVSEISKTLKAVAKEFKVPVIALAQLNRGVEGRTDRRPMLSDLRESGSIEQDADIIMMLYREDYYDRENPDIKGHAEVIIGKQRNGPTGTVKLKWLPEYGIFENFDPNTYGGSQPPMPDEPPPGFGVGAQASPMPPPLKGRGGPKNFAPGS
ncbi:MAG: replicative DNA helicase [Bdellovibrionales bacterium]